MAEYKLTMTKREAVTATAEMWQWLADTGMDKSDYFPNHYNLSTPAYGCFLCGYTNEMEGRRFHKVEGMELAMCVSFCPLYELWTRDPDTEIRVRCEQTGSPYRQWRDAKSKEARQKYALEVVKLCEKALEGMEE